MKNSIYIILIHLLILASCQNHSKENTATVSNQKDTTTADEHLSVGKQSNEVKSEAPDALTKTEQGYALPRFDDGPAQSPVNILSSNTIKENNYRIALKYDEVINAVENLGHTIQLDFDEGSTMNADGKIYQFIQMHFHTPSEHLIDGMTFPMELHMVGVSKKDSSKPAYIVIGMLFKMGRENKFIKEFLNGVPTEKDKKVELQKGTVKLKDLFDGIPEKDLESFYHYKGSFTTSPFTESVDWIVKKYILEASPEQVAAIEKMEGNNARHVQALYDRKIDNQ